jgi:hypothetical protein
MTLWDRTRSLSWNEIVASSWDETADPSRGKTVDPTWDSLADYVPVDELENTSSSPFPGPIDADYDFNDTLPTDIKSIKDAATSFEDIISGPPQPPL